MNPLVELRDLIDEHFDEEDVRSLCFDLDIDFGNLSGLSKRAKIEALILYCRQHGRLGELVQRCRELRPNVAWPTDFDLEEAEEPVEFGRPLVVTGKPTSQRKGCEGNFRLYLLVLFVVGLVVVSSGYFVYLQLTTDNNANISVRVADENGASIHGASILFFYEKGTRQEYSDSNGAANMNITYSGSETDVRVIVETNQYEIFEREISIPEENELQVRLKMPAPGIGVVMIHVVDDEGVPVPNADVLLIVEGNPYTQITDSNGLTRFEISTADDMVHGLITVTSSNYKINNQRVTLQLNRVQDIRLNPEEEQVVVEREYAEPENSEAATVTGTESSTDIPVTDCSSGSNDTRISNGDFLTCAIDTSGETDRFEMNFIDAERYILLLTKQTGDLSPCMDLYDPDGNRETACNYFASKRLDINAEVEGEYTLLVHDFNYAEAGTYTLAFERIIPPSESATALPFGMVTNGQLTAPGGLMQYVFDGSENDHIILTVTKQSGDLSPCLELYAPDGTSDTACNYFASKQLEVTLPVDGKYAVLVRDFNNQLTGDYSLNLQCITGSCN